MTNTPTTMEDRATSPAEDYDAILDAYASSHRAFRNTLDYIGEILGNHDDERFRGFNNSWRQTSRTISNIDLGRIRTALAGAKGE